MSGAQVCIDAGLNPDARDKRLELLEHIFPNPFLATEKQLLQVNFIKACSKVRHPSDPKTGFL